MVDLKWSLILCTFNLLRLSDCITNSSSNGTVLACYTCEETFNKIWDPFTECQVKPEQTGLKECLPSETYCMVEKISVLHMTISIKRQCTKECWYGCRAKGFGVTQLMCTSCCRDRACNTGNAASKTTFASCLLILTLVVMMYRHVNSNVYGVT